MKVETKWNLFCRGDRFLKAKSDKQNGQNKAKPPLAARKIGGELPAEENEEQEPYRKRQRGRHGGNYSMFKKGERFKQRRNPFI